MKYLSFFCASVWFTLVRGSSNDSSGALIQHIDTTSRIFFSSNRSNLIHTSNYTVGHFGFHNDGRQYLSNVLSASQRKCLKDVLFILKNINSDWAIKMFDSYGKIPSGVLLGNLLWIGKYDECVKVNVSKSKETSGFHGMYCLSQWNISLPNKIHLPMYEIPIKTGICLPDSCSSIDVKSDISHIIDLLYILPIVKQYKGDLKLTSITCNVKDSYLSFAAIIFLSFLGLYLLLPVTGSFLTAVNYFSKCEKKRTSPSEESIKYTLCDNKFSLNEEAQIHFESEECENNLIGCMENNNLIKTMARKSNYKVANILEKISRPLKCFCLFNNAAQVFNTSSSRRQFPCLHGLRFFSMTWVILGHTYVHNVNYIDNYLELLKGIDNLPFQALMQGTFSVDTFFLIGGFLLGYLYLEEADKRKGKINWLGLCLHRFLRITPVYVFLISFSAIIFNYLGSGPFWEEAADVATCKQYWWWNILYINNFLPINFMCLTWTWYLANDMQFFVLSSLILYVLWRWKYIGIGIFCTILLLSWSVTFYLSSVYNITPLFMGISEVKNYTEYQGKLILAWDLLYSKPYCRIGPHIIGILLAYIIYYNKDRKCILNLGLQVLGWCVAIFCSASVIYGLYHSNPNSNLLNVYNAFGRSAFSLGVAWLIFCCLSENAGFVNDILSYKIWIPFSRLTYCAYLFHPMIMNWYFQSRETPLFFTHTTMVFLFFSFLVMSYGVAFIISISFETPLINLEKILYER